MKEVWKKIFGYPGYEVSNLGRARSFKYKKEKFLKPAMGTNGYLLISPSKKGIQKPRTLHRIIAKAFIPNPLNKPFVCHKNNIKIDNRVENLYWGTRQDNTNDRELSENHSRGSNSPTSKLNDFQVKRIRLMREIQTNGKVIANIFKISLTHVYRLASRKRWPHLD